MHAIKNNSSGILWLALALLLILPSVSLGQASYRDTPAYRYIGECVDKLVMNDLQQRFGDEQAPTCIEREGVAFCLAPGMPQEKIDELLRKLPIHSDDRYSWGGRWGVTATDGPTGGWGNPVTLTYSFLPDGTYIPPGAGEPGSASSLYAEMNSHFGSAAVWKPFFAEHFAMWAEHIGITYVEVADDGASFPSATGVLGFRGDVRIGAHPIDGVYNILAYNYFPTGGDMVLDTYENWSNPGNDYVFFRNIVTHEHGHGHGLNHITPLSCTKLMEAQYCSNFTGPQDDDIRGGMRNYGDVLENDDDAATANQLGAFSGDVSFQTICLNDTADEDWFEFQVTAGSELDVTIDPIGFAYTMNGSVIWTYKIQDLMFEIRGGAGGADLVLSVNDTIEGIDEVLTNYALSPGTYWIRVLSFAGTHDVQRYDLHLNLEVTDATAVADAVPPSGMGLQIYPNPFNPKTTAHFYVDQAGDVSVQIFDVAGGLIHTIERSADSAGWMSVVWNGRDSGGGSVPTGIYFLRAQGGTRTETVRAVLLK